MAAAPIKKNDPLLTIRLAGVTKVGDIGPNISMTFEVQGAGPTIETGAKPGAEFLCQTRLGKRTSVSIKVTVSENDPEPDTGSGTCEIALTGGAAPRKGSKKFSLLVKGRGGDSKKSATFTFTFAWFVSSHARDLCEYIVNEVKTNVKSKPAVNISTALELDRSLTDFQRYFILKDPRWHAMMMWADQVDSGKDWDHKPAILKECGEWSLDPHSGKWLWYHLWSNIHYGLLGRELGFSADLLRKGAGAAAELSKLKTKVKKLDPSGIANLDNLIVGLNDGTLAALDEMNDQAAIDIGIALWEKHKLEVTADHMLEKIRSAINSLGPKKGEKGAMDGDEGFPAEGFMKNNAKYLKY